MQDGPYDRPPVPDDEELVGLRAAAEQLGVHYMTAYRYVRIGTLPARKVDGSWQVRIGDLRALTEQEPPRPGRGGVRWGPYRRRLRERLVAGDEPGAWSIVDRMLANGPQAEPYEPGSWGPASADRLAESVGGWHQPQDDGPCD